MDKEIAELQAARKRPRAAMEQPPSSSSSSSSLSAALPSVPSFLGGDRRAIDRQTRKLIEGAGQEGADESDDSIMQRHQESGGSGMVKKTELDDYKKRKFKYFKDKMAAEKEKKDATSSSSSSSSTEASDNKTASDAAPPARAKRARWDATPLINSTASGAPTTTGGGSRWDATPVIKTQTGTGATGVATSQPARRNRWDATPVNPSTTGAEVGKKRSRWDETPVAAVSTSTNAFGGASSSSSSSSSSDSNVSRFGQTPQVFPGAPTALGPPSNVLNTAGEEGTTKLSAMQLQAQRNQRDLAYRNRPLTDEDLDRMFPSEGYVILDPPEGYVRKDTRLLSAPDGDSSSSSTSTSSSSSSSSSSSAPKSGFSIQNENESGLGEAMNAQMMAETQRAENGELPFIKPEDMEFFGRLVDEEKDEERTPEEERDILIMKLLLKIKNGESRDRKVAMKTITTRSNEFGPQPLFNQILPLLMSPSLEDQERHLLVKVIDRILFQLQERVRPFVHRILMVIVPMLIDEDYYARVEGREIIANLSKAAGLATMIQTMTDDLSNPDEYVRNVTARAFAVVASALGISSLIPFLSAVCTSKKSWEARHTGIKIIQQIAILMGSSILPYLTEMIDMIEHGLEDRQPKVSSITALALSALAEAANPYGIECFAGVLKPLFDGVRR